MTTHPFLPGYSGPTQGWFTFLRHDCPVEYSANVFERRDYVWVHKPASEQRVRALACQVIPAALIPVHLKTARTAYDMTCTAYDTAYDTARVAARVTARVASDMAWAAYKTVIATLNTAWLCEHMPGTPWRILYDEEARTLRYDAEILKEGQP